MGNSFIFLFYVREMSNVNSGGSGCSRLKMCLLCIALHLDIGIHISYGDTCTPTVREFEI